MSPPDISADQAKSWMNNRRHLPCSQIASRSIDLSGTEIGVYLLLSQELTTRRLQS